MPDLILNEYILLIVHSGAAKGGGGGAAAPPPNVFQSVVLDSFKSDELRRGGVGKLSADNVAYLACIYS